MKRFNDVHQALAYYRFKNPARAKFVNVLEDDRGSPNVAEQFSGEHPADIWASIVGAVVKVLKTERPLDRALFEAVEMADERLHVDEAAEELMIGKRYARKAIYRIKDEIERELMRREIVEFRD